MFLGEGAEAVRYGWCALGVVGTVGGREYSSWGQASVVKQQQRVMGSA